MEEPVWTCGAPSAVIAHSDLEDETVKEVSRKVWFIRLEALNHERRPNTDFSAVLTFHCLSLWTETEFVIEHEAVIHVVDKNRAETATEVN